MRMTARRDARSLDHATLEEMRRLGITRVFAGETQVAVARSLQVHPRTVQKWVQRARVGGVDALASRKASGRPPSLSNAQLAQLKRTIVGKNPMQLNFGVALWTVRVIQDFILRRFGVALHATTVSRLMRSKLGLSPQKPARRAFQRDDAACRHWAEKEFPGIVRRAKRRQATILFADEAGVHEDGPVGTTWGERGVRPVVHVRSGRRRVSVISAISPRGRLWFRCFQGTLTAARFIEFLEAMLHDIHGKIVLVLDRHPAHVAAATKKFVLAHRKRLELHFLPAYAPDMNPDEHVWGYLKGMFRRDPLHADEDLGSAVEESMHRIAGSRDLVRSFFKNPEVQYAATALGW